MVSPGLADARNVTLSNGLEVVIVPRPGSPFHSVVVAYHGGRADERVHGAGVASLWAKQRMGVVSWGVDYEDRVASDMTFETLHAAGSDLAATLRQLHQKNDFRVFWPPEQFTSRLEAFQEEDDAPDSVFERRMDRALFGIHPYGRDLVRTDLQAVHAKDVYAFLDAIRRPENGIVVVVGDVDPKAAVAMIGAEFGRSTAEPEHAAPLPAVPPLELAATAPGRRLVIQNRIGSAEVRMNFRCALPKIESQTSGAAWLFGTALGNSFEEELREKTATSYGVGSTLETLRGGTSIAEVNADIDYAHLPFAMTALRRFIEQPDGPFIDDAWMARSRSAVARGFNLHFGTTMQLASRIASFWNFGWPLETLDRWPAEIASADIATVTRIADHCRGNWVVGFLGDESRIRDAAAGWNP